MHKIEYRVKGKIGLPEEESYGPSKWFNDIDPLYNLEEINFGVYSLRIGGIIYHRANTEGLAEAYNKAITWMRLNRRTDGNYTELW